MPKRYYDGGGSYQKRRRTGKRGTSTNYRKIRRSRMAVALSRARYQLGIKNVGTAGMLGMETNYVDYEVALTALTNVVGTGRYDPGSPIDCLNGVSQGDGPTQRTGMKITMKSIEIEGVVTMSSRLAIATTMASPVVFIALVLDTQTNGAAMTSDLVYTFPSAILASSPLRNMSYTERFKVLKKIRISMPPLSNTQNGAANYSVAGDQVAFRIFKKLKGLQCKYLTGSTTANISGIVDNSLHIVAWASDTSALPGISFNSRMRFYG